MTQGPIEFFLLAFPGTEDHGGVVAALQRAQALKDVRIIDALLVAKSADGVVDAAELPDVDGLADLATNLGLGHPSDDHPGDDHAFEASEHHRAQTARTATDTHAATAIGMNADDAEEIGAAMDLDSTALAMLVEHVWATDLAEAVQQAGGGVVAAVRIPRERFDDDLEFDDDDLADDAEEDEEEEDDEAEEEVDDTLKHHIRLDVEPIRST